MSDNIECVNATNSTDDCEPISCNIPRKKIKLESTKNRNARSLTDKMEINVHSNSWKFIDKNETMIAELSGGKLTLWQFLLELLMSDDYSSLIKWTDRNIGEFILIQAEEVAKLWGIRKDRNHRMNYDKLSRALRYYYQKNIIKKVHGHKFVYRFVSMVPDSLSDTSICPVQADLSPPGQALSDTDSVPNGNPSTTSSKVLAPPTMPGSSKFASKNNKKEDFSSTLTALFQAALMSLSASGTEIPAVRGSSPSNLHGGDNSSSLTRLFDIPNQNLSSKDCICKPDVQISQTSTGMFFPSSNGSGSSFHLPQFDRQSMLHFSRHSINMQRLSQEILLQATSKSRFNPCVSNPLLSPPMDSINPSLEPPNHTFWLNKFAHDLYTSTSDPTLDKSSPKSASFKDGTASPEVKIKVETSPGIPSVLDGKDSKGLNGLFQRFVRNLDSSTTPSSPDANKADPSPNYNNYSHADLANLIKSQLSSNCSFVWMPVPAKFAAEIMEVCVQSSSRESS